MSESNKVSSGNNWNQGDVISMEKVRTLLCDIYVKAEDNKQKDDKLNRLLVDAICSSLHLRLFVEDQLKSQREQTVEEQIIAVREAKYDRENSEYTKSMYKWMEENTND